MLGAVVASLREHRHVTSGLLPGEEREDDRSPAERADESASAPAAAPSAPDADPEPPTRTPDDVSAPQPARRTVEDAASVPAGDPNPPSGDGADPGSDTQTASTPDPGAATPSTESGPNTSADETVDATVQDREGQP